MSDSRTARFAARMEQMEKDIKAATIEATRMIQEAKETKAKPVEAVKLPEGDHLVMAFEGLNHRCEKLMEPMSHLAMALGLSEDRVKAAMAAVEAKAKEDDDDDDRPGTTWFPRYALVKVTANPNKHDYPKGTPIVVFSTESRRGLFINDKGRWEPGNHLPNDLSLFEPVTGVEMETMVEQLDSLPIVFFQVEDHR